MGDLKGVHEVLFRYLDLRALIQGRDGDKVINLQGKLARSA